MIAKLIVSALYVALGPLFWLGCYFVTLPMVLKTLWGQRKPEKPKSTAGNESIREGFPKKGGHNEKPLSPRPVTAPLGVGVSRASRWPDWGDWN